MQFSKPLIEATLTCGNPRRRPSNAFLKALVVKDLCERITALQSSVGPNERGHQHAHHIHTLSESPTP
jgi:hypothetical protein